MKYCLKYTNLCKNLSKADEIQIQYIEDRGLLRFFEKFSNQRIILALESYLIASEFEKLKAIHNQYPEYRFAVAFRDLDTCTYEKELAAAGIDFFVREPCQSWEMFHHLLNLGVSDINISGPLAFEVNKVAAARVNHKHVKLRVTPNITQSIISATDDLIKFYIRPDDLDLYEPYVDVVEFAGLDKQDSFFDIYKRKFFIGNLNQCIYSFSDKVDNKGLNPLFGERRLNCGQQCLKGGQCRRCYTMRDLSITMGEKAKQAIQETLDKEQERLNKEALKRQAAKDAKTLVAAHMED